MNIVITIIISIIIFLFGATRPFFHLVNMFKEKKQKKKVENLEKKKEKKSYSDLEIATILIKLENINTSILEMKTVLSEIKIDIKDHAKRIAVLEGKIESFLK